MTEQPLVLMVADEFYPDEPSGWFEVQHPDGCLTEELDAGEFGTYTQYMCRVGREELHVGVDYYFRHVDEPDDEWAREPLEPGSHVIRAWAEYDQRTGTWDGGLTLVEPPERDLTSCPYWQSLHGGEPNGVCDRGCWEEPRCYTEEPSNGWPSQRKNK